MGPDAILDIFRHMIYAVLVGVGVIVVPGLIMGLIIAIFQAATQINEMTLTFLPKLVVMLIVIALLAPWLIHMLSDFTQNMINDIPYMIG